MKTLTSCLWCVCVLILGSQVNAQVLETHNFTNINKAIPDGNASGLSSVQRIDSAIQSLTSLRVKVRIAGQFNGDLYGYLRQIEGRTNFCVLLNRVGRSSTNSAGYADSGFDLTFDDSAGNGDIHLYRNLTTPPPGTPLSGTWQPDGRRVDPLIVLDTTSRTTTLGSFVGTEASGEWTLYLADLEMGGTNMLVSWSLEFYGPARPAVTWPTPADIVYGTGLGSSQLNASSPVPGTFTYNPPAGTVLGAGSNQVLSVTFTPNDPTSYVPISTTVTINVLKAPLSITAGDTNKIYGAALPTFSAIYTGFVNGDGPVNLTSPVQFTTTVSASSPVASYPITPFGAEGSNYTISFLDGTLSIIKASTLGLVSSSLNPSRPGEQVTFTLDLNAVAPGAGIPTGTVQFKIDGANAGSAVPALGGNASYSTASLAVGTHTVVAEYPGDGNFFGTTNTLSPVQMVNTPPLAVADVIERDPTNGVKVAIATLLSNDTDADGDTITFISVSTNSPSGGTVTSDSTWVYYTPVTGFTNVDSFTYTISDGRGAPVTGTVTVNIRVDYGPSPNLTITDLGSSRYEIRGDGIPGRTYRIQFADDVSHTNWRELGTAVATPDGVFVYIDTSGSPQRFYRSVYP